MPLIVLLLSFGPLFFFKLGQSSLVSWDEAWYGEIAKQFLLSGNWLVMHFNGAVFIDHPPAGFWLIALGQRLFGMNEFGTRVASAVCGMITLVAVYALGKQWYSRLAGWCSAFALACAPWFLFRARSGNLDIFLTMFFVLTIYFAWMAKTQRRYMPLFFGSLALLLLTKTMVPFTIFPAVFLIFVGLKRNRWWELVFGAAIVCGIFAWWAKVNMRVSDIFLKRYFSIGLPGVGDKPPFLDVAKQVKLYFYNGIGRWFWFGMLGMVIGVLLRKRVYIVPVVLVASIMVPFLFSAKGQIWHMIPAYPFVLLVLFGVLDRIRPVRHILMLGFLFAIGLPLLNRHWQEFVNVPAYVSDEAILARKAAEYPGKLYLDDDSFPAVTFYSNKPVEKLLGTVDDQLVKVQGDFLLITRQWRIDQSRLKETEYQILARDRDKVLVRVLQ